MVFIISGLVAGATYGLLAVGIVLVFRSTNVLNFAHGAIGTLGAYIFMTLTYRAGIPVGLSLLLTMGAAVLFGGALYAGVFHRVTRRSAVSATIMTIVLVGLIEGLMAYAWKTDAQMVPLLFPLGRIDLGDINVTYQQIGTVAVGVLGAIGLAAWLRVSTLGQSLRALSDNPDGLRTLGVDVFRLGAFTWALAAAVGSLAAVLLTPDVLLLPGTLEAPLAKAFGAALIGGLRNAPTAVIGGLGIGVAEGLLNANVEAAGIRESSTFVLILVLLLVFRRQIVGVFSFTEGEARA
jgi:branched-chain amino acid transport system permease protein